MQAARREPTAWTWILLFSGLTLALHLIVNALDSYGIFRDEFYYLACASHLSWGYVDQPPFSLLLLAIQTALVGDSLFALRLLPSLLSAGVVLLAGLTVREFGGGKLAQASSAMLAWLVPCFLGFGGYYSMNIIDLSVWAAVACLLARLANSGNRNYWPLLGLVLGIGLLNKISVLYLGVGILAGIALSPLRVWLKKPCPYISAGIAFLIFLPHVIWQIGHDWPTLEFIENARLYKNMPQTPLSFLGGVMFEGNPVFLPFWLLSLVYLGTSKALKPHRWAFWVVVTVLVLLIALGNAKPYYADTTFFLLVAGFGLAVERWLRWLWLRGVAFALMLVGGALAMPLAIPILPPATLIAYSTALGLSRQPMERNELPEMQQFYADRFGWKELAATVSEVYTALSPEEQEIAYVFGQNYGEAGAVDYYADVYDLPPVISGHNSYWLWGPGEASGEVMLVIGDDRDRLLELFESVELGAVRECDYCMPFEDELPVWICRGLKMSVQEMWPEVQIFV